MFGQNPASNLGEDVLLSNGNQMITIAHHEPLAQVSLKCTGTSDN